MEGKKICYFYKFNFCKKDDCKYFHSSEVCDGKCDIKMCLKRHPQTSLCMFHTMFGACKKSKSCKFRHETPQQDEEVQKEEIQSLKKKIHDLEVENKKTTDHLKERILVLESTVKDLTKTVTDLTNNEMIKAAMIRQEEEEMMENEDNSIDDNEECSFMTDESSYYMWEDLEFKEILKDELCVTNNIKTSINDIMANLKPRNIQETMNKLAILNQSVKNDEIRLKNMERNSKNEHKSEKFYKMIDSFKKLFERLENTANNKFRKVAESELKVIYQNIINVQLEKSNNVYGMFDKTIDEES